MSNIDDNLARKKFQDRITKGMLGPGSDTWGVADNEEIISDYPLIRYFTGVLFPDKTNPDTQLDSDTAEVENESEENEELEESNIKKEVLDIREENSVSTKKENGEDLKLSQNSFFPTNIGLTICLTDSVENVDVDFSFGLYYQPTFKEKKSKLIKLDMTLFLKIKFLTNYHLKIN